jgi:hypothetical protein
MSMLNYDPKIWGPGEWHFLEIMARSLPEDINKDLELHIKTHFITLSYLLPCELCQDHLAQYIEETKLDKLDFSKKIYVMTWINDLHNRQLERKRTMKDVNDFYDRKYNENITTYKDLIMIFIIITIIFLFLKRKLKM